MFNVIVSKRYSQGKEVFDKIIRQNKIFFRPVKSGRFKGVGSSYNPTDIRHKVPYDNRSRRRKAYGRDTVPAVHRKQSNFGNDVHLHIYIYYPAKAYEIRQKTDGFTEKYKDLCKLSAGGF